MHLSSWQLLSCCSRRLTCPAACAHNRASSPCIQPLSAPSQIGAGGPAKSPSSRLDDGPGSVDDIWEEKKSFFHLVLLFLPAAVRVKTGLFYLIISTTSSSRNSSTGNAKPGMWIIGQLSEERIMSKIRINFPAEHSLILH